MGLRVWIFVAGVSGEVVLGHRRCFGLLNVHSCLRRQRQQQSFVCFLFVASLIGVALPSDVDARSGYEVHPGGTELILPLGKKVEDVISVSASNRQRVEFAVESLSSAVEYSAKGSVSNRRIEADFGRLGRINVRLELGRLASDPARSGRCKGRGQLYGEGTYRGTIKFSDQSGVPEVSVHAGRFYFNRHFRQVCKRQHFSQYRLSRSAGKWTRKAEEGILEVSGKGEGRTVHLEAAIFALRRNPVRSGGVARATSYEKHEGVRVTRWVAQVFEERLVRHEYARDETRNG